MKKSNLHKEFLIVVDSLVKKKLKENHGIELVLLAGSAARGDETKHSDIDINFFVKRKNMPSFPRKFYKYMEKYIEETYMPIEEFEINGLPDEAKILFDKNCLTKNRRKNSDKQKMKSFLKEWKKAEHYLKLAEKSYKEGDYEKSFLHLMGTKSLAFVLTHSLPPRFDLSYPSFRLFSSIKKAGEIIGDEKIYENSMKLFKIDNPNIRNILRIYEEIYKIIGKCYKNKYPKEKNLGFYDKLKIRYNIEGLRLTFKNYPPEFALRFIIDCITDWALDSEDLWKIEENKKCRKKVKNLTKEILGIKEFNREVIKEKLDLSKDLKKRIERFLKKNSSCLS